MEVRFKQKGLLWKLTFPFAHANFTTIGNTIYCPSGGTLTVGILRHELIHVRQQKEVGTLKFLFLYLFALPFLYNPWRFKWEYAAYTKGSKLSHDVTVKILSSRAYGWLRKPCA